MEGSEVVDRDFTLLLTFLFGNTVNMNAVIIALALNLIMRFFCPIFREALREVRTPGNPLVAG